MGRWPSRVLEAVQGWLQVHTSRKSTPFRLHLFCCGGSPIPLPPELKRPGEITEAQWDGFTAAVHALTSSADPPAAYGREIALCSAGATAKKDAVLFELRLKLHSTLLPHMLTYVRLIEDYEGELLGNAHKVAWHAKPVECLQTLSETAGTPSTGISGTARTAPTFGLR